MATQQQIQATYDYMDELFRLTFGENADITCAMYDGDFSKTLEQAQADKHAYILDAIHFKADDRVLDIGCGWGPMLHAIQARGGRAIGVTLSPRQAQACTAQGLEAHVKDWKEITAATFGTCDAIVSVGAFEHFCSVEEYQAGRQELIYRDFFRLCAELLPRGGRLYLQTMLAGKNAPAVADISLEAEKSSNAYLAAVLLKFYPGSYLPLDVDQVRNAASPLFNLVSRNNGRKDYIETMNQWGRRNSRLSAAKVLAASKLVPYYLADRDFRYKVESLRGGYNKESFKREMIDHERMVFEKL